MKSKNEPKWKYFKLGEIFRDFASKSDLNFTKKYFGRKIQFFIEKYLKKVGLFVIFGWYRHLAQN